MSLVERSGPVLTGRQAWTLVWVLAAALVAWLFIAVWPAWLDAVLISKKAFINSLFNGVTLAGLYFLVASGFTLVFGLMRNVNLAHGSLYLLGAYLGYEVTEATGVWLLGVAAGFAALAVVGLLMQVFVFRRLEGDELRQTLVTLGIAIVAADLMLAIWTGVTYQIGVPAWLDGAIKLVPWPIVTETMDRMGYGSSESLARCLGAISLVCTALYALPPTSFVGAILMTGYLGGAMASHVRIGSPLFTHILFGFYLGVMLWGGLWLRDRRLRTLLPFAN